MNRIVLGGLLINLMVLLFCVTAPTHNRLPCPFINVSGFTKPIISRAVPEIPFVNLMALLFSVTAVIHSCLPCLFINVSGFTEGLLNRPDLHIFCQPHGPPV